MTKFLLRLLCDSNRPPASQREAVLNYDRGNSRAYGFRAIFSSIGFHICCSALMKVSSSAGDIGIA